MTRILAAAALVIGFAAHADNHEAKKETTTTTTTTTAPAPAAGTAATATAKMEAAQKACTELKKSDAKVDLKKCVAEKVHAM